MAAYVGIDLAWSTNARTGLAVVDAVGALRASGWVRTDADIDAWLDEHCRAVGDVDVLAVDAPLIVTNATGQRPCEKLITGAYGRYQAGCHSSNLGLTYMNPARASELARRHGWATDPAYAGAAPLCLEVYPHAAMVGLFELRRTLKYKKGKVATRRFAMLEVLRLMETLEVLRLATNPRWAEIRDCVAAATYPRHLNVVEDEVDAILCAHLAWRWRYQPAVLQVYGDATSGYIVAPPPPVHPHTPLAPSGASAIRRVPVPRPQRRWPWRLHRCRSSGIRWYACR